MCRHCLAALPPPLCPLHRSKMMALAARTSCTTMRASRPTAAALVPATRVAGLRAATAGRWANLLLRGDQGRSTGQDSR